MVKSEGSGSKCSLPNRRNFSAFTWRTKETCEESQVGEPLSRPAFHVIIDGVWIYDRIYWTRAELRQSHWVSHSKGHCNNSTHKLLSVFTSRYLVAAIKCRRSPSSWFPNCLRPQLPDSHFSLLKISADSTTAQSQSQSYFMTVGLSPIIWYWRQVLWGSRPEIFSIDSLQP
jgi:hypothetical protein